MSKKHIHNWTAISSTSAVIVDGACVFVCHCGEIQKIKIPKHDDMLFARGRKSKVKK